MGSVPEGESPITIQLGSRDDIARAVQAAADRSGGWGVHCSFGTLRVGAHADTPLAVICERVDVGMEARRA